MYFTRDFVLPASFQRGILTQMIKGFKSEYNSLQKIGIAMCPQCLEVEDEAVKLLKEYAEKSANQYRPLFLTLSSKNKAQFEKKKKPQRQTIIPQDDDYFLDNWNELPKLLREICIGLELKKKRV